MSPALEELIRALARAAVDDHLAGLPAPSGSTPDDIKEPINAEAQACQANEPRR